MLKIVLGLLTGPLGKIAEEIKEAYQSKLNAKNEAERIAADERIAVLEARKTTILAAQSSPVERWVRTLWAAPFILYNLKLVVYDKMFGLGATDPLSPELYNVMMITLGGYFFVDGIKGMFKK